MVCTEKLLVHEYFFFEFYVHLHQALIQHDMQIINVLKPSVAIESILNSQK